MRNNNRQFAWAQSFAAILSFGFVAGLQTADADYPLKPVPFNASHTSPLDTVTAIGDGKEPRWSSGKKVPRWTSRPQEGTSQWIEARFPRARAIRSVGVYWMQDRMDVWSPKKWSLEVEQSGKWNPFELYVTDRYGTRANQYNVVHPAAPLTCDAIRIRMIPQQDKCVGILEVQVAFEDGEPEGNTGAEKAK